MVWELERQTQWIVNGKRSTLAINQFNRELPQVELLQKYIHGHSYIICSQTLYVDI